MNSYNYSKSICLILPLCLLIVFACFACTAPSSDSSKQHVAGFSWVREESRFLDYSVSDQTVSFRYILTFENNTNNVIEIRHLAARFSPHDLSNWVQYENYFDGILDDGGYAFYIYPGELKSVAYSFKGTYLGGEPGDIGIPTDVSFIQLHHDANTFVDN